ncbi:MAG: sulfite reductase subunit C [Candidatus Riflebacteria bacterium]|nr:sulfite reductase subunit C [Candidatus Riflebacteria bacterium]
MSLDLNRKKVTKNAYRITKRRNYTALRVRVPGGHLNAAQLSIIAGLAETFGDGTLHVTARQGFEIPNIPFERMSEVNAALKPLLAELQLRHGVQIDNIDAGYPGAGMRNISACVGNRICPFANADTTALAQRLEGMLYPNDLHVKIAVTGCPNDCVKVHLQDFGIVAICEPEYHYDDCIGCEACVKACERKVTGALTMQNGKVYRDERRCIGCGECVLSCPTAAWTRRPGRLYRVLIMGRTGKRNPRLAMPFLDRVSEDVVCQLIKNTLPYAERHRLKCIPKEHIGYIVDRTGLDVFKEEALTGIEFNPGARIAKTIQWPGYNTLNDANFKLISK